MKNSLSRLVWPLFFLVFFLATPAFADEPPRNYELKLEFTSTPYCKRMSLVAFVAASHPGGNPFNRFNEQNPGIAHICEHADSDYTYNIYGGLTNSRFGETFTVGYGIRYKTPELWHFSASAGVEIHATYYEVRDTVARDEVLKVLPAYFLPVVQNRLSDMKDGWMILPVPVQLIQVNFRLPWQLGTVSMYERRLAFGKAVLRGYEYTFINVKTNFF